MGLAALGLGLQIYKMDSEINKMGGEIQKVEVQLTTIQTENSKRFDKLDLVLSSLVPKIAIMENNLEWMRGDHGVVNLKHDPSNQETKPFQRRAAGG